MFSNVTSLKPDSSWYGECQKRIGEDEGRTHLNASNTTSHEFGNFKRQLPLRDGLTNPLVVRRQDLIIVLMKISAGRRLVGRTFDAPMSRPENLERKKT